MNEIDWKEVVRLIGIQKNIALNQIDESNYGSGVFYQARGFYNGLKIAEEYIVSRLGKREEIER